MGKRTQVRAPQKPEPTVNKKQNLVTVSASTGSLQRVVQRIESAVSPSAAVGSAGPQHEQIAVRAYQLWEAKGRPVGTDREDWIEAERLMRV